MQGICTATADPTLQLVARFVDFWPFAAGVHSACSGLSGVRAAARAVLREGKDLWRLCEERGLPGFHVLEGIGGHFFQVPCPLPVPKRAGGLGAPRLGLDRMEKCPPGPP